MSDMVMKTIESLERANVQLSREIRSCEKRYEERVAALEADLREARRENELLRLSRASAEQYWHEANQRLSDAKVEAATARRQALEDFAARFNVWSKRQLTGHDEHDEYWRGHARAHHDLLVYFLAEALRDQPVAGGGKDA